MATVLEPNVRGSVMTCRITKKKALAVVVGRLEVILYKYEWLELLLATDDLRAFVAGESGHVAPASEHLLHCGGRPRPVGVTVRKESRPGVEYRVTDKGAVSVVMGGAELVLSMEEWLLLLGVMDEVRAFMSGNGNHLRDFRPSSQKLESRRRGAPPKKVRPKSVSRRRHIPKRKCRGRGKLRQRERLCGRCHTYPGKVEDGDRIALCGFCRRERRTDALDRAVSGGRWDSNRRRH